MLGFFFVRPVHSSSWDIKTVFKPDDVALVANFANITNTDVKKTEGFVFSPCRQECKKLREELKEEHEEDKASALSQLAQSKEQELCSARESWQRKVEDLLEQVLQFGTE